jgi:hypothetical protein
MKNLIILSCVFFLFSCTTEEDIPLTKLSRESLINIHVNDKFDLSKALFLTREREKISKEDVAKIREGIYACDYYVDENQTIKETIVRPATYHDRITNILIRNIGYDPRDEVPVLEINCDSIKSLMPYLFQMTKEEWPDLPTDTLDHTSFQAAIIVTISFTCGMPSEELLGAEGLKLFWLMVQHNDREVLAYYYPHIEKITDESAASQEKLALSTDRLLAHYGYPQVYGSQIVQGQLHPIENPDSVDFRRAAIGISPLSEYLEYYYGL